MNRKLFAVGSGVVVDVCRAHGTFFDVGSFPYLNLTDPRTFVPGMPFALYVGARATF